MSKKLLAAFLIFLFLDLVLAAVFLVIKLRQDKIKKEEALVPTATVQPESPKGPIQKTVATDGTGVVYKIRGKFTAIPNAVQGRKDKAISGPFIITGDDLQRELTVLLGLSTGTVSFGTYQKDDSSSWSALSTEDVLRKIKLGQEVELVLDYGLPEDTSQIPDYLVKDQEVLDTLAEDISQKTFTYQIPKGFVVYPSGLGILYKK